MKGFTLAIVCLFFLAALSEFIFHLTMEEAKVENPIEPFLPSACTESLLDWVILLEPNTEAAIEDLLAREPRLTSPAAEIKELPGESLVSLCPDVEGVRLFDALPAETRRKRELPASPEKGYRGKDAVEDLRRFWVSDGTIGNVTRDPILSEHFWRGILICLH